MIHRKAWISIEDVLYVWDFESALNLVKFSSPNQQLILDALLVPKPDELYEINANNLFLISTPTSILVFAVTTTNLNKNEFHSSCVSSTEFLIGDDCLVSCETLGLMHLLDYKNKRIFANCLDTNIYEISFKVI